MRQRIQNARIKNYFIDILKLNPLQDVIPDYVKGDVQPVVEIDKPILNVSRSNSTAATTSATIYTTPTDRDFYLTNVSLSYIKNATCDLATGSYTLTCFIDGQNVQLIRIPILTLTLQEGTINIDFDKPMKIDRNTVIGLAGASFTAGAFVRAGAIQGYIDTIGGV